MSTHSQHRYHHAIALLSIAGGTALAAAVALLAAVAHALSIAGVSADDCHCC